MVLGVPILKHFKGICQVSLSRLQFGLGLYMDFLGSIFMQYNCDAFWPVLCVFC